jgi:low molecular weight protein-tyrosine phosphatase
VSDELRVAFVCTGNRFRSPLAAALLAQEAHGLPVEIASLGTLELGAEPALPEAIEIARTLGLDLSSHRARSLAGADLRGHDLVLGFERKHVLASVVDARAPLERTFTLPELVRLLREIPGPPLPSEPAERSRVRIRQAHVARLPGFRDEPMEELGDPLGLSEPEQHETARQLAKLVSTLARRLFA